MMGLPAGLLEELAPRQLLPERLLCLAGDLRRERDPLEILGTDEVGEAGVRDLPARTEVQLFQLWQISEVRNSASSIPGPRTRARRFSRPFRCASPGPPTLAPSRSNASRLATCLTRASAVSVRSADHRRSTAQAFDVCQILQPGVGDPRAVDVEHPDLQPSQVLQRLAGHAFANENQRSDFLRWLDFRHILVIACHQDFDGEIRVGRESVARHAGETGYRDGRRCGGGLYRVQRSRLCGECLLGRPFRFDHGRGQDQLFRGGGLDPLQVFLADSNLRVRRRRYSVCRRSNRPGPVGRSVVFPSRASPRRSVPTGTSLDPRQLRRRLPA